MSKNIAFLGLFLLTIKIMRVTIGFVRLKLDFRQWLQFNMLFRNGFNYLKFEMFLVNDK